MATAEVARFDRIACPSCARDVAVSWVNVLGFYGVYHHRTNAGRGSWCASAGRSYGGK